MNEALACGWWLYDTLLFHIRINIHSKKKYKLASIAQSAHRSCGNNHFKERSPGLKANFKRAKKLEKSAFLRSLMYALVRDVCRSSISDSYITSRAHMLAYFAQSAHFCVQKQTHTLTDTPITLPLVCARGNDDLQNMQPHD